MAVAVSIPDDQVEVAPGAEQVVPVRLRNQSAVVDQLTVSVVGSVAAWAVVEPAIVRLFPDAEETVAVRLRPAADAGEGPIAGRHVYGIRVRSQEDPAGSVVEERTVVVAPKAAVAGSLRPTRSSGRRAGRHQLVVENRGNTATVVTIEANDPDDLLAVKVTPEVVKLQPGEAYVGRVRPSIMGRRPPNGVAVPFAVYLLADGKPGAMIDGAFVPRGWPLRTLLALAVPLVAVGVLIAALVGRGGGPESGATAIAQELTLRPVAAVSNLPEPEATERLEDQGFGVRVTRAADDAAPGTVVGQDPPAGTQLEEGAEVEIVVSLGPDGDGGAASGDAAAAGADGDVGAGDDGGAVAGGDLAADAVADDADSSAAPEPGAVDDASLSNASVGSPSTTAASKAAIPAVAGRSSAEAAFMLGQRGFAVKIVEQASKTLARSLAISTQPAAGALAGKGSTVVLTVSSGRSSNASSTTDLVASRDGVTCSLQGSTMTVSFFTLSTGTIVSKAVTRTVTASNGFAQDSTGVPSSKAATTVQLTVGAGDFGKPMVSTIVVDPSNGVSETDENNNVLAIELTVPATAAKVATKVSCRPLSA